MIPAGTVHSEVSAVVFTDIVGCIVERCQSGGISEGKTFDCITLFPRLNLFHLNIRGDPHFQMLVERVKYQQGNF